MTLKDIEERVQEIEDEKLDTERAHLLEDELYRLVLQHFAECSLTSTIHRMMAQEALKTQGIEFARMCS